MIVAFGNRAVDGLKKLESERKSLSKFRILSAENVSTALLVRWRRGEIVVALM